MNARLIVLLVTVFSLSPASAALDVWVAINLKTCNYWPIDPTASWAPPKGYQAYCPTCPNQKEYWVTLTIGDRKAACNLRYGKNKSVYESIYCEESNNFPLSGATYKLISKEPGLATWECSQGCKTTNATRIYDLGDESEESNVEHETDFKMFNDSCKKK